MHGLHGEGLDVAGAGFPILDIVIGAAPHRLARITARARCIDVARADDCVFVGLGCVGFFRGNEAGAHPDANRAEREGSGKPASVIYAASGNDRNSHGFNGLSHEGERADEASVSAAFAALQDDRIASGLLGFDRVFNRAPNDHDFDASIFELFHDWERDTKACNKAVRAAFDDHIDRFFKAGRIGGEEVDAKGLVRSRLHIGHLFGDEIRRGAGHSQNAVSASIAHSRAHF